MSKRKLVTHVGLILLIVVIGLVAFLAGHQVALRNLTFKNVSANQAAQAMKNDEFFTDYKENTLIVRGTVSSLNKQGRSTIVGLKTGSSYELLCNLNNGSSNFKAGDNITIEAIGGNAVRQSSAVLLQNCVST